MIHIYKVDDAIKRAPAAIICALIYLPEHALWWWRDRTCKHEPVEYSHPAFGHGVVCGKCERAIQ